MRPHYHLNVTLAAAHVLVQGYQYLWLPLFLLPSNPLWGWTVLPLALVNNALWSLIHEAIHGHLHPDAGANAALGRVLAVVYGAPLRVLRVGHLLHHRHNRSALDCDEVYDPPLRSRRAAAWRYYTRLLGGLYLSQILSPLAFVLPAGVLRRAQARYSRRPSLGGEAAARLVRPEAIREIRLDGLAILSLFGASALAYGSQAGWLLAVLGMRAVAISFLDYVYHYGTPLGAVLHGKNLRLGRAASALLLNFNLHGVHHRHPTAPWWALPDLRAAHGMAFDEHYLRAALRQLRGPIALDEMPRAAV